MKIIYQEVLMNFKKNNISKASNSNSIFPGLIKSMVDRLMSEVKQQSIFKKCGLCPLDPAKAVERIPHILSSDSIMQDVDASLLKKLKTKRFGSREKKKTRGKILAVPAGRSYTGHEDDNSYMSREDANEDDQKNNEDEEVDAEVELEEGEVKEVVDGELPDVGLQNLN
jgi:hypothetical protein